MDNNKNQFSTLSRAQLPELATHGQETIAVYESGRGLSVLLWALAFFCVVPGLAMLSFPRQGGLWIAALADFTRCDARVHEALAALAQAPAVGAAARALGVLERTLERLIRTATGEPPRYWRALARVRRAAQALTGDGGPPLAAIAADHGYADQAHFGRECRHWLGQTPARLRASKDLLASVQSSGYG